MKLKLNQNLTINGKNNLKGSIVEVEEKDAKSILSREWATEVKVTQSVPKKATPAVAEQKQIEEPKKVEEVVETARKATSEAKKATKPATPKKTTAKAKTTKAPVAKKATIKKA